jgi:hypothetical protein
MLEKAPHDDDAEPSSSLVGWDADAGDGVSVKAGVKAGMQAGEREVDVKAGVTSSETEEGIYAAEVPREVPPEEGESPEGGGV